MIRRRISPSAPPTTPRARPWPASPSSNSPTPRRPPPSPCSCSARLPPAFGKLPVSPHVQVVTIPGIGTATAAALVAKIVDIKRFATPDQVVGYFGVFPEEDRSGVDQQGHPLPPGTMPMSRKGNDLV